MALLSSLRALVSLNPLNAVNAVALRVLSRDHHHSTYSTKRKIPPAPEQIKDKYDIDMNPRGGLQGWTDWGMKRDYRKRQSIIKYSLEGRLCNLVRRNDILPREIREIAEKEMLKLPREADRIRIIRRCCVSSRHRGVVYTWRLSRHFFRHFADYNKLSGVQRGIW